MLELKSVDREGTFVCEAHPDSNYVFWRLYVRFSAMRKDYLAVGRLVFGLDVGFLKTMLGGCLLVVVGRDSNNQMYPLAWAVVDSKNEKNWRWFMGLFTTDYNIIDGYKWIVISDQQKVMKYGLNLYVFNLLYCSCFYGINDFFFGKGLCNVVAHHMPNVEHINCARHVFSNWKKN